MLLVVVKEIKRGYLRHNKNKDAYVDTMKILINHGASKEHEYLISCGDNHY